MTHASWLSVRHSRTASGDSSLRTRLAPVWRPLRCLLLAVLAISCLPAARGAPASNLVTTQPSTRPAGERRAVPPYRNPIIDHIGPADPAVIRYQGRYYLYPTWDCRGYDAFVSEDLVHWERKPKCFTDSRGGVWAPDVFHHVRGDGKFYLYYTVDQPGGGKLIGVALADHPLGPFADRGTLVKDAIDAHLFQDDDGKMYLYYCDVSPGFNRIAVVPMADPLHLQSDTAEAQPAWPVAGQRAPTGARAPARPGPCGASGEVSRPTVLISPTDDWERRRGAVAEGPWMLKRKGVYYLMYSGSGADGPDYAIGYATSKSPLGPFTKHAGNPIAKRGNGVFGPGHHCVITGPDGKLWMVYHQQNSEKTGWHRFLAIDPLWFDEQGVIHATTTRGQLRQRNGP